MLGFYVMSAGFLVVCVIALSWIARLCGLNFSLSCCCRCGVLYVCFDYMSVLFWVFVLNLVYIPICWWS